MNDAPLSEAVRITAVRHGETAWNVDTRIQGQRDIGLNARGLWQAQRVGAALADSAIDQVYASDLSRALRTAQAVAQHAGLPVEGVRQHTGLRERAFGHFEGQTYADIHAQWPQDALAWRQRQPHWAPPGGESPTQLRQRVQRTLHEIACGHGGQHIVLVSHGGVMDMLYRLATQQPVDAERTWALGNCAINRLLWTPQALTVVGWADTHHLDADASDEGTA
ncbi:MAG: histidine phosphatase family protein [Betaproteobacteria bacterium]